MWIRPLTKNKLSIGCELSLPAILDRSNIKIKIYTILFHIIELSKRLIFIQHNSNQKNYFNSRQTMPCVNSSETNYGLSKKSLGINSVVIIIGKRQEKRAFQYNHMALGLGLCTSQVFTTSQSPKRRLSVRCRGLLKVKSGN